MSDPEVYSVDKAATLDAINQVVRQNESMLGALIAVANDGTQTLLTFERDPPKPTQKARLLLTVGGTAVIPPGSVKVCEGTALITGQKIDVVAVRP
jgi:hypothetical protein